MSLYLRKVLAEQVAQVTSGSQKQILPLITPVTRSKKSKGQSLELGLSISSLRQDGKTSKQNKRVDTTVLNEEAWKIAKKLVCPAHVHNITVENGVVHFSVDPRFIVKQVLGEVSEQGTQYGYQTYPEQDEHLNIIVEYSSPNIAKPFHAGHLRSTLIGHFLANLHESLGHNVTRINYLGDWGTQFGILGVGFQEFGNVAELALNPIQHLYQVYVATSRAAEHDPTVWDRAKELFRKMEQGDTEALQLRQQFRDLSITEYKKTYERLGICFDEYSSEAQYSAEAQSLLAGLKESGLLHTSERGTCDVDLADVCPRFPTAMLAKSDGASLYLTRDISAALDRWRRYSFDRMYYVVDKGQEGHFQQLRGVLNKMGQRCHEGIHHVPFGKVLGMQTRKGTAVFLTDILEEAKGRMLHNMESTATTKDVEDPEGVAEVLGVSAIILQDLKGSLLTDYTFDWDRVLTSQGDTGVFLQYCHARLCSIEETNKWLPSCASDVDADLLLQTDAIQLAWHVSHYDVAVRRAAHELEPKAIAQYLLKLGHLISRANNNLRVKGSPDDIKQARLALFNSARTTLSNGMHLLGMKPLTKM